MTHCNNIRKFSTTVYHFLTDVFMYNLNFSELGLTDHLLHHIIRYSNLSRQQDIEIYKMPWTVESVYGNDIDLFIQNSSGTFNWYALQAKVMSPNGAFSDIKIKPIPVQQWDKLLSHEAKFGSKTFYLLYCGQSRRPPNTNPTRPDCIGVPSIEEYGAAIVETNTIKSIRTIKLTRYANLYFRDVFPDNIDSLRKLFCCAGNLPTTYKQFNREEISADGYQKVYITDNNIKDDISEDNSQEGNLKEGFAPIRIVITNRENGSY